MPTSTYPWTREWTTEPVPWRARRGLLAPAVQTVPEADFAHATGLVLLGEAGLGKSTELRRLAAPLVARGLARKPYELSRTPPGRLSDRVSRTNPYKAWQAGSAPFYLFLDALDEAPEPGVLDDVADLAGDGGDPRAFHVWLTCRRPYWGRVPELRSAFADVWGGAVRTEYPGRLDAAPGAPTPPGTVCELHLAWLSDDALRIAAHAGGVEPPQAFVDAVNASGDPEVARSPDVLREVIAMYGETGTVPRSRVAIYDRVVPQLVTEPRRQSGQQGRAALETSPRERLAIARRVAGVLTMCRRRAVREGHARDDEVSVSNLLDGQEPLGDGGPPGTVRVTTGPVLETLNTGLFGGHPNRGVEFARAPWREYLAARWLGAHKSPADQVVPILSAGGRVRPELAETAAWCATVLPDVFDALVETDPDVLTRADLHAVDAPRRRRLLLALATLHASGDVWIDRVPDGIGYPEIEDDLRPWLQDAARPMWARLFAARVARAASVHALAPDCVRIALDGGGPDLLHQAAIAAAVDLYGRGAGPLDALVPVMKGDAGPDPHHDLAGLATRALVPERVSADDALALLPTPTEYRPADPFLEAWVEVVVPNLSAHGVLRSSWDAAARLMSEVDGFPRHALTELLVDALVLRLADLRGAGAVAPVVPQLGWEQRQSPPDAPRLVLDRWRGDEPFRRDVLDAIVAAKDGDAVQWLERGAGSARSAVPESDWPWLVRRYADATGGDRAWWARLVSQEVPAPTFLDLFGGVPDADDPVRGGYTRPRWRPDGSRIDHDLLAPHATADEVAALEAATVQEFEEAETARHAQLEAETAASAVRLAEALDPERGGWADTLAHLDGVARGGPVQSLRSWPRLDADQQRAAVALAVVHLRDLDVELADGTQRRTAQAALYTAYQADRLGDVPESAWGPLGAVLVREGHPPSSAEDKAPPFAPLVERAWAHDPDALVAAFRDALGAWLSGAEPQWNGLGVVASVYDPAFGEVIKGHLQTAAVGAYREMIGVLLYRDDSDALALAAEALAAWDPNDEPARLRAAAAARALLRDGSGRAWGVLGPVITASPEMLDAVLDDRLFYETFEDRAFQGLDADGLAAFYRLLDERYPYTPSDRPSGLSYRPGQADRTRHIKDRVLEALRDRGPGAAPAYAALAADFPALREGLRREQARWASVGTPLPTPSELIATVGQRSRRLLRSADDLFAVVTEGARAFGAWLQDGEQPGVYTVWNEVHRQTVLALTKGIARRDLDDPNHVLDAIAELAKQPPRTRDGRSETYLHAPKREEALSDALARFLRSHLDGAVVGRETEVKPGHKPDLLVSAFTVGEGGEREDVAQVGVEVKPSWSPVFDTALESQLVAGYLDGSARRHGVYVAAIYGLGRWANANPSSPDSKQQRSRKWTLGRARTELGAQADSVTARDPRVRVGVVVVNASLPAPSATGRGAGAP